MIPVILDTDIGMDVDDPGEVFADGIGAIGDTVAESTEPVTVIAIGPLPNLATALENHFGFSGREINCATGWRDREAFLDFLTDRLLA